MSKNISSIQTLGDYFRRSDETGTPNITAAKKLEAAALACEDIQGQALFRFTQRVQRFDYLDGYHKLTIFELCHPLIQEDRFYLTTYKRSQISSQ